MSPVRGIPLGYIFRVNLASFFFLENSSHLTKLESVPNVPIYKSQFTANKFSFINSILLTLCLYQSVLAYNND